jgi:hypothetical protein
MGNGYDVNPWEATGHDGDNIAPVLSFNTNDLFGDIQTLNVAFADACPYAENEHYFPRLQQTVPVLATLRKEDELLRTLQRYDAHEHENMVKQDATCAYNHVVFEARPSTAMTDAFFLNTLFDKMHAGDAIPFIQWMDDNSRILYKVAHKHAIDKAHFQLWTAAERVPRVPTSLVYYSPVTKNGVYARVFITLDGTAVITYHMDIREKVSWSTIVKHKDAIMDHLKRYTGLTYKVAESDVSVRTELVTPVGINDLSTMVSKALPIFYVLKTQAGYIEFLYKRSSNYEDDIQLTDYIQSKINMGMTIPEVIESLVDMGISQDDARAAVESLQNMQYEGAPPVTKKIRTGTIIKVGKIGYGIKVHVLHCPSIDEVRRALHWLRCCILHVGKTEAARRPQQPARRQPIVLSASTSSTASRSSEKPKVASAESSVKSDDLGFLSDGGAVGKENQRYFLNMLQEADPDVFNNSEFNYARTCQASSFHQPVVLSKEEYGKLVDEGFGDAVDNSVTYGSDPQKQNVYFCPRIWCPVSKRPITYDMYVQNGNKCPSGENAKLLYDHPYWNNSHETKHYIGFHKKKTSKGVCLPCCYIKPLPKEKERECVVPDGSKKEKATSPRRSASTPQSPAAAAINVKDTYIMTQVAPLPEGRSGNIPQVLHEIITPNIQYQLCTKTLVSHDCPVRRGISHKQDSLMEAIAYALGKESKKELIEWIRRNLDPLTFLSLENGNVVAAFIDNVGPIPQSQPGVVKEVKVRLRKHTSYREIFHLDSIDNDVFRMSRELQLYKAWLRYLQYLASDEQKSPYYLYDLLYKLGGYLLVIWNKEGANDVMLNCPLYTSISSLTRAIGSSRKTIMFIQENGVYEPIELRRRHGNGTPVLDTKYTTTIDNVLDSCGKANDGDVDELVLKRISTLQIWAQHILSTGKDFVLRKAIISPDLYVSHVMTAGNFLIQLPGKGVSIGYLPRLIKDVGIHSVMYHEDVAGRAVSMRLLKRDMDLFMRKLRSIGFGYVAGTPQAVTDVAHVSAVFTIPFVTVPPTILVRGNDDFAAFEQHERKLQTEWTQLQRMIGQMFLQHYDTLVRPLLSRTRKERVDVLMNTFPSFRDKKRLRVAIDEIPLEHGRDAIVEWMRMIGYDEKYPFLSSEVMAKKGEWVFSQRAVEEGLPSEVMRPIKKNGSRPKSSAADKDPRVRPHEPVQVAEHAEPPMLTHAQRKKLPSKWTQIRNYEWGTYNVLQTTNYTRASVRELLEWIARRIGVPVFWGDIQYLKTKYITSALFDERSMLAVLEDPSITHAWMNKFGKSFKTPKIIWEKGITKTSRDEVRAMWSDISSSDALWPGDLDFFVAAKLMDVSILMLHRTKYGANKKNDGKRGDIDDLATSSSLYTLKYSLAHIEKRPICILYKDVEKDNHAVYSPITNPKDVFLFSSLFDCPKDIWKLVEFHVQHHHTNDTVVGGSTL